MSKLSLEARSLLKTAMAEERPASPANMRRVRQGVKVALLSVVPIQAAASVVTASISTAKVVSFVLVGVGLGVTGVGVTNWATQTEPPKAAAPLVVGAAQKTASFRPNVASAPPSVASTADSLEVSKPPTATAPREPPVGAESLPNAASQAAAFAEPTPGLTQELSLLSQVQAQLRRGNGERALQLLDQYRGPTGGSQQLAEERLAAEVFAACSAGDVERARRAARQFLARAPGSPLAPRVRSSCGVASP